MHYIADRIEAYANPCHVLDGCRTILMLALPYRTVEPSAPAPGTAKIARYAWGEVDYHDVLHDKLKSLKQWLQSIQPSAKIRGIVDTAPLLEREFAEAAGIGWVGKNTLLLNRDWGSYFFLAALLTELPLVVDEPQIKGYCGTCTACLDACPTNAFVQPYVMDARRCLSYLTIEHRGPIADDLAGQFDEWLFGCDVCQDVCPWNRKALQSADEHFLPQKGITALSIDEVLRLDDEAFQSRFRNTPLWRSKRRGILRNAILIAVRQNLKSVLPQLERLTMDDEPLLREVASWAISRL
jgi:epoxyqueuosine reductase